MEHAINKIVIGSLTALLALGLMITFGVMNTQMTYAAVTEYNLCVGGTWVTSGNAENIPKSKGAETTGNASYNAETNTLTLENYKCTGIRTGPEEYGRYNTYGVIEYKGTDQLTIELVGENELKAVDLEYNNTVYPQLRAAIFSEDGSFNITGDGELVAYGPDEMYRRDADGILTWSGNIIIDGPTIYAQAGRSKTSGAGIDAGYACKLLQFGWETIGEALKFGGITNMMDRLSNPAKIKAFNMAEELKDIMRPLYRKHMDDIESGKFSETMMKDWADNDKDLLRWRKETQESAFENAPACETEISEQEYFDKGIFMVATIKAGVELAFETMTESGIYPESAYYESLHELPLIANTIARKRLYEMNVVISDTAEYGNYLFSNACVPLLKEKYMSKVTLEDIGVGLKSSDTSVDNQTLIDINEKIRNHPIEVVGHKLRGYMKDMKRIVFGK